MKTLSEFLLGGGLFSIRGKGLLLRLLLPPRLLLLLLLLLLLPLLLPFHLLLLFFRKTTGQVNRRVQDRQRQEQRSRERASRLISSGLRVFSAFLQGRAGPHTEEKERKTRIKEQDQRLKEKEEKQPKKKAQKPSKKRALDQVADPSPHLGIEVYSRVEARI